MTGDRKTLDELIARSKSDRDEAGSDRTRAVIHMNVEVLELLRDVGTDEEIARVLAAVRKDVPELVPS